MNNDSKYLYLFHNINIATDKTNKLIVALVSNHQLRGNSAERQGQFTKSEICYRHNGVWRNPIIVTCTGKETRHARYVYIYIPEDTMLTLCEVEVYSSGKFPIKGG